MASIDRWDWHVESVLEEGLPEESAATHIGFYIQWLIDTNRISPFHHRESKQGVEDVKSRKINGATFLLEYCDGKFWDQDIDKEALPFTLKYYTENTYFADLMETFDSYASPYEIPFTEENYRQIQQVIEERFNASEKKKFWQFWQ